MHRRNQDRRRSGAARTTGVRRFTRHILTATLLWAGGLACVGPSKPGPVEVLLCDGETKLSLANQPSTRAEGQRVAELLMSEWNNKHPEANWDAGEPLPPEAAALAQVSEDWESEVRRRYFIQASADNSALLGGQSGDSSSGAVSAADLKLWKRETERLVAEGARIFHSSEELGSSIAVSCDMCHPDAANTHPETYPKYQVQIGRAVLLRDMINWCLEHPVRADPWAADDARMTAVEAYILAQRKGKLLNYGQR